MRFLPPFVLVADFCGPLRRFGAEAVGPQQPSLLYSSATHELLEKGLLCLAFKGAHPLS